MSDWINFVKRFSKENNISYSQALKEARPYYNSYKKQHYNRMAEDLLGYGGEQAQKGALAALLSGLDAQIKIN